MDTKALRQKILDLAIRGKLVPQDPDDEPASVLLEKIREQKQQMFKEGKLKKKDIKNDSIIFKGEDNLHYEKFQDGTVKCIEDEIPFEIPKGWAWCHYSDVIELYSGQDLTPDRYNDIGEGIPYITGASNLEHGKVIINRWTITPTTHATIGDLLLTVKGSGVGKMAFCDIIDAHIARQIMALRCTSVIMPQYLYIAISAMLSNITAQANGIIPGIRREIVLGAYLPLPPRSEQEKICKIADNTLHVIDDIDTNKGDLKKIIQITQSKILDLAIRGKLVPQDPNDEPASVLLDRICAEKEELIKQGKIKRDKKESIIFKGEDNSYYGIHLPDGWDWASLREIALSISDGSHNPPPDNGRGIPLLSAANINDNSILMNEISRWITNEEWKIENQRTNIEVGDVLLTIVGSIGRSAVVQNSNHFALQRSVAVIKPCLINPLYLMHIVQSPQIQKWLTDNSKGTAQKGIYLNALSLMIIPIPPLAEQARIVEKIHIAYKQLDLISNALL